MAPEDEPPPALDVVEARLVAAPEPPWQPPTRRHLYARLATVRRFLTAWRQLQPLLSDPREPLDRPVRVLALLEAVAVLRPLLDSLPTILVGSSPGGRVTILLRQPLVPQTLRALLPDQRRAVTADWQRTEADLVREYHRLRELDRSGRPFRRRARTRLRLVRRLIRWVIRTPEALLIALAVVVLMIALLRGSRGP
jgi:hypothetical protein